jgi:hypothetical protein
MKFYRLMVLVHLMPMLAMAQAGSGVGGGGFTEPEMKGFMNILSDYFATKDYSALFPEVVKWEQKSNLRMSEFIKTIEPKVVNHPVYFPAGIERDCVSYFETQGTPTRRWFECNAARIPESKLENQPKLYGLLAHEVFVQAGIEKAGDANVPSTYEVSSKFLDKRNLTLETIQRYVPGPSEATTSVRCSIELDPRFTEYTYLGSKLVRVLKDGTEADSDRADLRSVLVKFFTQLKLKGYRLLESPDAERKTYITGTFRLEIGKPVTYHAVVEIWQKGEQRELLAIKQYEEKGLIYQVGADVALLKGPVRAAALLKAMTFTTESLSRCR